jgi:hypothetical protein
MTTLHLNQLNTFEGVDKTLDKYQESWMSVLVIGEVVTEYKGILGQIRTTSADRSVTTTGLTKTKSEKRAWMIEKTVELASLGFVYAERQKDQTLKAMFNYTKSDLVNLADNAVVDQCTAIYNQLNKLSPSLSPYGITATDLEEWHASICSFKNTIGEKGSTKGTRSANTQRQNMLFKQANSLLKNQLDKLMVRYKKTNPDFYNAYVSARVVADLGGGKTKKLPTAALKVA